MTRLTTTEGGCYYYYRIPCTFVLENKNSPYRSILDTRVGAAGVKYCHMLTKNRDLEEGASLVENVHGHHAPPSRELHQVKRENSTTLRACVSSGIKYSIMTYIGGGAHPASR